MANRLRRLIDAVTGSRMASAEVWPMPSESWEPTIPAVSPSDLANAEGLVVHFWAPWAASLANRMEGALTAAAREVPSIEVRSCNVEEAEGNALAAACKIVTVPTLVFIVRGRQVDLVVGCRSVELLTPILKRWAADVRP